MHKQSPHISIIVPAYAEREQIGANLRAIKKYVEQRHLTYEILVIVDGSPTDTADIARGYKTIIKHLRVIAHSRNRGKGFVVRYGLLRARGAYRVFLDADGSTSIAHLDQALQLLDAGADLVVGSRAVAGAYVQAHQPLYREWMGCAGNLMIRAVLGLWTFPDTQCGFKVMRAAVAEAVAPRMKVDRFGFDFELIVLAQRMGFAVVQMPVRWLNETESAVRFFGPNGFVRVMSDLCKTRVRLWRDTYHLSSQNLKNKN